jgi:hypothetical protein
MRLVGNRLQPAPQIWVTSGKRTGSEVRLLREPLLHFVLIGAVIYMLYGTFAETPPQETDRTVVVTSGEVEWMYISWQKRWNRPPTAEEFNGLIEQYIRETVLYSEALTMGLNKHDQVIRRRLAQKLEFLAKDLVNLAPPTDEDLQAYFEENRDRYQQPLRYTFTQVFLDPDKRGNATLDDAESIKAQLIAGGEAIKDPGVFGDDSMLQNYFPEKDAIEIQKSFGRGFVETLIGLSERQWQGPILSGFGTHLVYVHSIIEPPAPVFAEVRELVEQDWKLERSEELNEQFYANLRDNYTIIIEEPVDQEILAISEKMKALLEAEQ